MIGFIVGSTHHNYIPPLLVGLNAHNPPRFLADRTEKCANRSVLSICFHLSEKGSQPLRKAQNSAPCQFSTKLLQFSDRASWNEEFPIAAFCHSFLLERDQRDMAMIVRVRKSELPVNSKGAGFLMIFLGCSVAQDGVLFNIICKSWCMCNSAVWEGPTVSNRRMSIPVGPAHHSNCFWRFKNINYEFGFRSLSRSRRSSPMVWEV
jgi:hypothetical protein